MATALVVDTPIQVTVITSRDEETFPSTLASFIADNEMDPTAELMLRLALSAGRIYRDDFGGQHMVEISRPRPRLVTGGGA